MYFCHGRARLSKCKWNGCTLRFKPPSWPWILHPASKQKMSSEKNAFEGEEHRKNGKNVKKNFKFRNKHETKHSIDLLFNVFLLLFCVSVHELN